jgi:RNA polymerase sigma-70 factor, ECF subfamily
MPREEDARTTAEAVARRSYGKLVAFLAARTGDVAAAEDALSVPRDPASPCSRRHKR